mgnify:FL=1
MFQEKSKEFNVDILIEIINDNYKVGQNNGISTITEMLLWLFKVKTDKKEKLGSRNYVTL